MSGFRSSGEEDVAVEHDEVVVLEELAQPADAAAGALDLRLVDDVELQPEPRALVLGDRPHHLGEVVGVDADLA